jgi:hypothetical protein
MALYPWVVCDSSVGTYGFLQHVNITFGVLYLALVPLAFASMLLYFRYAAAHHREDEAHAEHPQQQHAELYPWYLAFMVEGYSHGKEW